MEAARAPDNDPHRERIGAALAELGRDRALARLLRIATETWERFDRATIEDALSASIESAYTHSYADNSSALYCWLAQDLRFRLLNEKRDVGEKERLETKLAALELTPERCASLEEEACHRPNAELAAALLSDFSPRDQNILRLAWGEGERRVDIAEQLEISESIVKHTLKRGGRRLRRRLCNHVGGGCGRSGEDRVHALAFQSLGSIDDPNRELAHAHMRSCGACATLYEKLEEIRLGAAALAPVPAAAERGAVERASDRVVGAVDWTREQLTGVYLRAHELAASPPPMRPGAALAGLGVCAAAAGGGYCLTQGVSPLTTLAPPGQERAEEPKRAEMPKAKVKAPPQTPTAAPTPTSPAPAPPPAPTAEAKSTAPALPAPAPPAPPPSQAAPSPPAPQQDFDFEQSRPPAPRAPAAAPTQGGGEFF